MLRGDLDEVRAAARLRSTRRRRRQSPAPTVPRRGAGQVVGLGDELHVAVLDAVVHHLHVVAGAARAHVLHARLAVVGLGGDRAEDRRERVPRRRAAAGHDGRTAQRAFFAAGDAGADEVQARGRQLVGCAGRCRAKSELPPSIRMSPGSRCGRRCAMTLSTAGAGRHHDQHAPRPLERRHQRFRRARRR